MSLLGLFHRSGGIRRRVEQFSHSLVLFLPVSPSRPKKQPPRLLSVSGRKARSSRCLVPTSEYVIRHQSPAVPGLRSDSLKWLSWAPAAPDLAPGGFLWPTRLIQPTRQPVPVPNKPDGFCGRLNTMFTIPGGIHLPIHSVPSATWCQLGSVSCVWPQLQSRKSSRCHVLSVFAAA